MNKFRELAEQYFAPKFEDAEKYEWLPEEWVDDLANLLERTWWQDRFELLREQNEVDQTVYSYWWDQSQRFIKEHKQINTYDLTALLYAVYHTGYKKGAK